MQFGMGFAMSPMSNMGMFGTSSMFGSNGAAMYGMGGMGGANGIMQMQMMQQMYLAQQMQMMNQIMQLLAAQQAYTAQQQGGGSVGSYLGMGGNDGMAMMPWGGGYSMPPSHPLSSGYGTHGTTTTTDGSGISSHTQQFIDSAKSHQGAPYVFGASGHGKYDCSGLVYASLKEAGVNVPRLTARGYQAMFADQKVGKEDLKPGDLVFFWSPNDRGIPPGKASHVEVYLGNGMTMGTDNPKEGAKIEPINWKTFIGGARVPQLQA